MDKSLQQRTVLKHMGITVWQRHIPGQTVTIDSAPAPAPAPASAPAPDIDVDNDKPALAPELELQVSEAPSRSAANLPPSSFDDLLSMTLAGGVAAPDEGKILVLCLSSGDSTAADLSADAWRLLNKMMAAIELAPGDWSQLSLSAAKTQQVSASSSSSASPLTLQQLLARQRIPALLLLLPAQMISKAQSELNMGCDHGINAQPSAARGQGAEPVLAGKLPASHLSLIHI